MSKLTENLARETVTAFRDELPAEMITQIGPAQFERLELLVAEAVAAALHHAAERVDGLARSLRGEGEEGTTEIEL